MIKKIVLIMVLLFIFFVGHTFSNAGSSSMPLWGWVCQPPIENKSEADEFQANRIIGIALTDYREYLRTNPPLDRLYLKDDVGFFLVKGAEVKEVEKSGVTILGSEPAPARWFTPPHLDTPQGDLNGAYHSYNETQVVMRELESRFPSRVQVITIGYSLEGRPLNIMKISDNVDIDEAEPNIYILGCHHAREWISVEVPLGFAQYLLEHSLVYPEVEQAITGAQVYILPIQNPDGLEFSIHTYRMWRKNRRYNGNLSWGVDTNRNYGYMWGYDNRGSSPNPASEVYRGSAPFSEPETDAIRGFLLSHPPAGLISYHNYSQLILYPWGYTYAPARDAAMMREIAMEMSFRISRVNGRQYTCGSADTLYLTNGDTTDWVYGTFGVPAFTIELPPENFESGGFITPEELITPVLYENIPALVYFINRLALPESPVHNRPGERFNKGKKSN